ncbi:MAG TPA: peptide-methionine (S)-S-oxide reductase MsrA [Rudaea sp.]|nr:peptide-methionine (S)-S-oxide reductase MsrA [Rudaea sp.]
MRAQIPQKQCEPVRSYPTQVCTRRENQTFEWSRMPANLVKDCDQPAGRIGNIAPLRIKLMYRTLLVTVLMTVATTLVAHAAPMATTAKPAVASSETVTLGGGCFWCLEAVFDELKGVSQVESGYAGGHVANPDYIQVSAGDTGHAEVVQITFDPHVLPLDVLLRVYFTIHDPTTLNRQGNDVGTQYRSIAFYRDAGQKAAIEKAIAQTAASGEWHGKIVTQVEPFTHFYKAENYHQEYFKLHGTQPYCRLVIAPKVAKFRKLFHAYLKR